MLIKQVNKWMMWWGEPIIQHFNLLNICLIQTSSGLSKVPQTGMDNPSQEPTPSTPCASTSWENQPFPHRLEQTCLFSFLAGVPTLEKMKWPWLAFTLDYQFQGKEREMCLSVKEVLSYRSNKSQLNPAKTVRISITSHGESPAIEQAPSM